MDDSSMNNGSSSDPWQASSLADGNLESFSEKLAPFLRPKCALWSCCEPAEGLGFCPDYCCDSHWVRAIEGGRSGKTPIMRPGGIGVKDGPLFATVCAKLLGKHVGIPNCEGAASTKPPWNDPEFSLSFLDYERLREWLFFDKPRRSLDRGNRKPPNFKGRFWHESKSVKDGPRRTSYYMDPQPRSDFKWHLYEYSVNDVCALYRLRLKFVDKNRPAPNTQKKRKRPAPNTQKKRKRPAARQRSSKE